MATQEQVGWNWTPTEKQWIKTWKRRVQSKSKWLTEQVNRFQAGLPEFADEAAKSAQPYLRTAKALLILVDRAKHGTHLLLSPDEAKQLLYGSEDNFLVWSAFTQRPDVQAAMRDANRQIRAQNRIQQKQRQAPIAAEDAN